jgi:hypothetical protein
METKLTAVSSNKKRGSRLRTTEIGAGVDLQNGTYKIMVLWQLMLIFLSWVKNNLQLYL